jgi:hypothetical protein
MRQVRFRLPVGLPVILETSTGRNFEARVKKEQNFKSCVHTTDPYSAAVCFQLTKTYFLLTSLRDVEIEGGRVCDDCRGVGNLFGGSRPTPERCMKCMGKGFITTLEDLVYRLLD